MNRRLILAATLLTGLVGQLGLVGCAEEMDPPSLLERTRVVGARVEVEGAPERATPRPGETATVSWLVTSPAGTVAPLSWAFVVCPGGGSTPVCLGEPVALLRGHETAPVLKLTVPAAEHLNGVKQFVILGRICVGSDPVIDDNSAAVPRCAGDGEGTTAAVSVPLESADVTNHNPNLGVATLNFAGAAWNAQQDPDCAALPQVRAGSKDHVIRLETAGEDREPFMVMMGDPPRPTAQREWLQISQFTSHGKLDRAFSSIEANDQRERPAVEMKWEAPGADKVVDGGLIVRFVFVARDLRGGIDWTNRAVCVTK